MGYSPFRGRNRDPSLCYSHSPQPSPIRSRYIITWSPGTGRYPQAYCTFWQLGYSQGIKIRRRSHFHAQRGYLGEPPTRSWEYGVDSGTTKSMAVLHGRFRYYGVDCCTPASSAVLRNRFLSRARYCGMDSDTTESFKICQSQSM